MRRIALLAGWLSLLTFPALAQVQGWSLDFPDGGTTLWKLATLSGSPSEAVIAPAGTASGIVGIAAAHNWQLGPANVLLAMQGGSQCIFDGATSAGDYFQASSSTAGDCHDAGATYPTSGQVLGNVLSTNSSGGTYPVVLGSEGVIGAGTAPSRPAIVQTVTGAGTGCYSASSSTCTATVTATGAGHEALIVVEGCGTTGCGTTSAPYTVSVTDPANDVCNQVVNSGATNPTAALFFFCPSITTGTTSFVETSSAALAYPGMIVNEVSGAAGTEATNSASSGTSSVTSITCGSTTTTANDLVFLGMEVSTGPAATLGSPWSNLGNYLWDQAIASPEAYSGAPSWTGAEQASCASVAVTP